MNWFNKSIEQVSNELSVDINEGLNEVEVEKRKKEYGLNELKEKKNKNIFVKFTNIWNCWIYARRRLC